MKTKLNLVAAGVFLAAMASGSGAIRYVDVNSTSPTPPYTNWDTAAKLIQDAVDAAKDGDMVLVTNGVYAVGERDAVIWSSPESFENLGSTRVVIANAITLRSVNGPLTATIDGGGSVRCVFVGAHATLSGFTLTNGFGPAAFTVQGAGVWSEASGIITNCVITRSRCFNAGGVYGGNLYDCTLSGNSAAYCGGGALGCTMFDCTLMDNVATGFGGIEILIPGLGGGAYDCRLFNCTLAGNQANNGGGAYRSILFSSTVISNSATYGGGADESTLDNCRLSGNSAGWSGGGTFFSVLYNCTLATNSANDFGGGVCGGSLYNCIVYYNNAPNGANYFTGAHPDRGEIASLLYSSCTTPLPANGVDNIAGPPFFLDMAGGDLRLREDSPCIDAGTNLSGRHITAFRWVVETSGYDIVALGYVTDPTDILGNTRFIDGNGDGKVAWDMGAYEFNSFPPPRFTAPPKLAVDGWKLNVTGAPNKWVSVQRSSNFKDWEDIWSGWMGAEGVNEVTDGDMGQRVMCYRAVVQ